MQVTATELLEIEEEELEEDVSAEAEEEELEESCADNDEFGTHAMHCPGHCDVPQVSPVISA